MKQKDTFIHDVRRAVNVPGSMPATHKLLMHVMADHWNAKTRKLFPSQELLAAECECSERAVRYHLKHLQSAGWVELVCRGRRGTASEYRLAIGQHFEVANRSVTLTESIVVAMPEREQEVGAEADPEASVETEAGSDWDF